MIIRPLTLVSVLGACAVGLGLYMVKYEVQDLKDELSATNRQIVHERESLHVLNAEWSLLNDPSRLSRLAQRYLGMSPVTPAQIQPVEAIPYRSEGIELVTQTEAVGE